MLNHFCVYLGVSASRRDRDRSCTHLCVRASPCCCTVSTVLLFRSNIVTELRSVRFLFQALQPPPSPPAGRRSASGCDEEPDKALSSSSFTQNVGETAAERAADHEGVIEMITRPLTTHTDGDRRRLRLSQTGCVDRPIGADGTTARPDTPVIASHDHEAAHADVFFEQKNYCYRHDCECDVLPHADGNRIRRVANISGTTCTDWSQMGKKMGFAGASSVPFAVWTRDIERNVDWAVQEITPTFPVHVFDIILPGFYWQTMARCLHTGNII